jgi:hypothetical protein
VHGLFDDPYRRRGILRQIAEQKGIALDLGPLPPTRDQVFDALAEHVSRHCDVTAMFRLAGIEC